ncbi:MAG: ROK family protein [Coprobacillus sp.]
MKRTLHEMKTQHMYQLLLILLIKESATMQELIEETLLSQASVRNMLRYLEDKRIIQEVGSDKSTGGRCAIRFSLDHSLFQLLCLYVHENSIELEIYNYKQCLFEEELSFGNHQELIEILKKFVEKYKITAVVIAVKGMVKGDCYITDHHNQYEEHRWVKDLKECIDVPVYLENDVKVMQLGTYFQKHINNSVYLYINDVGVGSSFMLDGHLIKGVDGLAGEIGLLPYRGVSINEAIRQCQTKEELTSLIVHLLMMVSISFNPQIIHLSFYQDIELDIHSIKKQFYTYLNQYYQFNVLVSYDVHDDLYDGLQYLGISSLLKLKVEEE